MTDYDGPERRGTDARVVRVVRIAGAVLVVVLVAVSVGAFIIANAVSRIDHNADLIAIQQKQLDAQQRMQHATETQDRDTLRAAAWRGCARDMLDRADSYSTQRATLRLPIIRQLFPPRLIQQSIDRRLRTLPILNCDPNLCGRSRPALLPAETQSRFVDAYIKGRLDANPEAPKPPSRVCPPRGDPLQLQRAR